MFYKYPSLAQALAAIYPDHPWDPQRFSRATPELSELGEQIEALEQIGRQLNIKLVHNPENCGNINLIFKKTAYRLVLNFVDTIKTA